MHLPPLLFGMALCWCSSPLVLLLSFSSLCLLTGVLLLDGGAALSTLLLRGPASVSAASSASAALSSQAEWPMRLSSLQAALPFAPSAARSSPHSPSPPSLLSDYQAAAAAVAAAGAAHASAAFSAPSAAAHCCAPLVADAERLEGVGAQLLLSVVDDPSLDPALSWDTGHALLQFLAGVHLALRLHLPLVVGAVFPGRPHWDAFVGLGECERRELALSMEFEAVHSVAVRHQSVAQLSAALPRLQQAHSGAPLLLRLEGTAVTAREEDSAWLADDALSNAVAARYCAARAYRPVPVDLYAAERISGGGSAVLAVHVECEAQCDGGQVEALEALVRAVQRALARPGSSAPSPGLSVHLFADRSALRGDGTGDGLSDAAVRALAAALRGAGSAQSSAAALSVHEHTDVPSTWAMHHYITADLFIGNLQGSAPREARAPPSTDPRLPPLL